MAAFTPIGVEAIIKGERGFTKGLNLMQAGITGFATAAAQAAIQGVAMLGKAMIGLATSTLESSISVESAFAGVIKTTDGLVDDMGNLTKVGAELKQEFRELALSVPVEEVEELMFIGELGGQLGIAKEDLIEFTEVIAAMGVSTNLTTEDAATQFAQFANVMGTVEREGTDAFSKLGSTIVALGNTFATNEADIANFASRIAGAGAIAGVSESDILAIGAAMSSVGVQAEAGGTAVQKVLLAINQAALTGSDDLEIFAAVAGKSVDEFATLWEDDAGAAFETFVSGLGEAGDDALLVLDELGLKDQRLIRSFLSLANAGSLLTDTMNESSQAWDENIALTNEAAQRYATTESQIQLAKNQMRDFGITIGDAIRPFIGQALNILQPFIKQIGEVLPNLLNSWLVPALQKAMTWLGEMLPRAIQFLSDLWTGTLQPALKVVADFIVGNVVPVLGTVAAWLIDKLPLAIQFLSGLWTDTLQPALETVASWLGQLIPLAIDVLTTYWNTYLLPLFQSLAALWTDTLQPALAGLWAWVKEKVPQAIEVLAQFWENTLKPVFIAWAGFITETLVPAVGTIVAWLIDNIPRAIEIAAGFWEETLKPALEAVWEFIQENVIPIIEDIVEWLQENIPVAIEEARRVWEEVLLPAITTVYEFIRDDVIPIVEDIVDWLKVNIPKAIEEARRVWEEVLLPALKTVWAYMSENIFPILEDIWSIVSDSLKIALEVLAGIWEKTLQPALETVWKFLDENVVPIFKTLFGQLDEDLGPVLETVAAFLEGAFLTAVDLVGAAVKNLADWIGTLLDKVREWRRTDIPDDYQPGSPPPLFYALTDIGAAMADLAQVQIPQLTAQMTGLGRVTAGGIGAGGGNTTTNNITLNATVTSGIGAAAFQARTLRTVQGAIAA